MKHSITFNKIADRYLTEFNAPEEAKQILKSPNTPSGRLPHSLEAVLDELNHWGQIGHPREMDPEIEQLAMQLADLLKKQNQSKA